MLRLPPTAVIHVLNHDSRAQECPAVGLTQSFECGDYAALCWPVLEHLMAAVLISQQKQHAAVSP